MDSKRFDAISRLLATSPNRRMLFGGAVGGALSRWFADGDSALANHDNVAICHFPAGPATRGGVRNVPRRTLRVHLRHGDFRISARPGRTRPACRSTCKGGKPICGAGCCRGLDTCERRYAFLASNVCCPAHRVFVECPTFHICPENPLACCAPPEETYPFCCPAALTCGSVCCYEGEQCVDPSRSLCTCPEAQQCGPNCCWPGLRCLDESTGECEEEVGYARLRRP